VERRENGVWGRPPSQIYEKTTEEKRSRDKGDGHEEVIPHLKIAKPVQNKTKWAIYGCDVWEEKSQRKGICLKENRKQEAVRQYSDPNSGKKGGSMVTQREKQLERGREKKKLDFVGTSHKNSELGNRGQERKCKKKTPKGTQRF